MVMIRHRHPDIRHPSAFLASLKKRLFELPGRISFKERLANFSGVIA